MKRVPHCKECKEYDCTPSGQGYAWYNDHGWPNIHYYHACKLLDKNINSKDMKTSPKWCPNRSE